MKNLNRYNSEHSDFRLTSKRSLEASNFPLWNALWFTSGRVPIFEISSCKEKGDFNFVSPTYLKVQTYRRHGFLEKRSTHKEKKIQKKTSPALIYKLHPILSAMLTLNPCISVTSWDIGMRQKMTSVVSSIFCVNFGEKKMDNSFKLQVSFVIQEKWLRSCVASYYVKFSKHLYTFTEL